MKMLKKLPCRFCKNIPNTDDIQGKTITDDKMNPIYICNDCLESVKKYVKGRAISYDGIREHLDEIKQDIQDRRN